jgi:hypothetical protein
MWIKVLITVKTRTGGCGKLFWRKAFLSCAYCGYLPGRICPQAMSCGYFSGYWQIASFGLKLISSAFNYYQTLRQETELFCLNKIKVVLYFYGDYDGRRSSERGENSETMLL